MIGIPQVQNLQPKKFTKEEIQRRSLYSKYVS